MKKMISNARANVMQTLMNKVRSSLTNGGKRSNYSKEKIRTSLFFSHNEIHKKMFRK